MDMDMDRWTILFNWLTVDGQQMNMLNSSIKPPNQQTNTCSLTLYQKKKKEMAKVLQRTSLSTSRASWRQIFLKSSNMSRLTPQPWGDK